MNKIFTQIVKSRGLTEDFIHPRYEDLEDPSEMPDMGRALERIEKAIETGEKILIYGDYDVDGVTASTVMEKSLLLSGAKNIEIMLPDRFIDGYGMSPRLIEKAKEDQISLVITVDCGSRNHAIVDELNEHHIDTIITDHHECEDTLPEAVAVINAHRHDFKGPETLQNLAGVGVAFKVAQGLVKKGLLPEGQEKWLLDLVLIGTLCDSMVLSKENRILTHFGKIVLEKTHRPGLIELMKKGRVDKVTSEAIGFRIGPRLNAAGRLKTATISLNLLRTNSAPEAAKLATMLETLNKERKDAQLAALAEIEERINSRPREDQTPVIIETGYFHEGVIGIVAGRLVEEYHRPAFVLTEVEDGLFKGSGRSFGEFNLAEALNFAKDTIEGGGGHAMAAGVQVKKENLYAFREKINEYYRSQNLENQDRFLKRDPEIEIDNFDGLDLDLMDELACLEPFGTGNEEPIFLFKDVYIAEIKRMGRDANHLMLGLKDEKAKFFKTVAFYAPEAWFNLDDSIKHTLVIQPTINEFNGTRSVEGHILGVVE